MNKSATTKGAQIGVLKLVRSTSDSSKRKSPLAQAASDAAKTAVSIAKAHGLPITVGVAGKVIKKFPDGREEILAHYGQHQATKSHCRA